MFRVGLGSAWAAPAVARMAARARCDPGAGLVWGCNATLGREQISGQSRPQGRPGTGQTRKRPYGQPRRRSPTNVTTLVTGMAADRILSSWPPATASHTVTAARPPIVTRASVPHAAQAPGAADTLALSRKAVEQRDDAEALHWPAVCGQPQLMFMGPPTCERSAGMRFAVGSTAQCLALNLGALSHTDKERGAHSAQDIAFVTVAVTGTTNALCIHAPHACDAMRTHERVQPTRACMYAYIHIHSLNVCMCWILRSSGSRGTPRPMFLPSVFLPPGRLNSLPGGYIVYISLPGG